MKHKKIIFLDGDGTLWYPKKTKHTVKPHWVYKDQNIEDYHLHLMMIPDTIDTLKKLKRLGVITVILSTHPQSKKAAQEILTKKVNYFKINSLFDEVHATEDRYESKGEYIVQILKKLKIPKSKALMVGDNYFWDYKPARNVGVDALLLTSDYMKKDKRIKIAKSIKDLLRYV
jgi:HAD superfamily phosphatase (TIGR01681 family)